MPKFFIAPDGTVRHIHDKAADAIAAKAGDTTLRRASNVEVYAELPAAAINWLIANRPEHSRDENKFWASLLPSGGPVLGPFDDRAAAVTAELLWLDRHQVPTPQPKAEST